ncbi:hypothetical protein HELRODRAFT_159423 [Helobdella robusta]|uniref:PEHE domain-containing protein n=1 Tax=Helobdella robusta TaxID=6412 RepID=T1EP10_HELRO|nr:hypothetical protein HELRODRAFT_159423 [Helobdella robusta]ESO12836.1 hypothetical protein HELRODRAFT_159423 [Helobdella robusta]
MTQIAVNTSAYCNTSSWPTSEFAYEKFDRNRSNWLERFPRSHHYSRRNELLHDYSSGNASKCSRPDRRTYGQITRESTTDDYKEKPLIATDIVEDFPSRCTRQNVKINLQLKKAENLKFEIKNSNCVASSNGLDISHNIYYNNNNNSSSNKNVNNAKRCSSKIIKNSNNKTDNINNNVNNDNNATDSGANNVDNKVTDNSLCSSDTKLKTNISSHVKPEKIEKRKVFGAVLSSTELLFDDELDNELVPVPHWRIQSFTGKYVIEGTEDLSDNVYTDRHSKHESSERKRKKRDERCLEDLEKLNKLNSNNKLNISSCNKEQTTPKNTIRFVEITENEPRCIFGSVLPEAKEEDFSLPSDYFTSSPSHSRPHCTRRKKHKWTRCH